MTDRSLKISRTTVPRLFAVLVGCWVLAYAPRVWSQSAQDAALRTAAQQRQQGRVSEAIRTLRAQYTRDPTPRLAAELARSLVAASEWLEAEALLAEALATADPWIARNRAGLERVQHAAQQHLCRLEIRANAPSARLIVDDRRLGERTLPTEVWLLPGTHLVEGAGEGGSAAEQVRVTAGDRASVMLRLQRRGGTEEQAASVPATTTGGSPALLGLGIASTVLAVGAAATGVTAIALRQTAARDFNVQCPPIAEPRSMQCTTTLDTERTWGLVRWIALPAAGAFTIAAALAFWGAGRSSTSRTSAARACVVDPVSLSISCAVRF